MRQNFIVLRTRDIQQSYATCEDCTLEWGNDERKFHPELTPHNVKGSIIRGECWCKRPATFQSWSTGGLERAMELFPDREIIVVSTRGYPYTRRKSPPKGADIVPGDHDHWWVKMLEDAGGRLFHPGNLLETRHGGLFLETSCRNGRDLGIPEWCAAFFHMQLPYPDFDPPTNAMGLYQWSGIRPKKVIEDLAKDPRYEGRLYDWRDLYRLDGVDPDTCCEWGAWGGDRYSNIPSFLFRPDCDCQRCWEMRGSRDDDPFRF